MLLGSSRSSVLVVCSTLPLELQLAILKIAVDSENWTDEDRTSSYSSRELLLDLCKVSKAWAVSRLPP